MGTFGVFAAIAVAAKMLNAIADRNNEREREEKEREWEKERLKAEAERQKEQEKLEKERQRAEEIEKQRCETPCEFNDGFTKEEFEEIAQNCAKKIRRIKYCTVYDLVVLCRVTTQSGISEWSFALDFRDFGHFTERCWIWSGNDDSSIPARMKELICTSIASLKRQKEVDETVLD